MIGEPRVERRSLRGGKFDVPVVWSGRGRPLVYLHDVWGPLDDWRGGHLSRLAERYLVLAPSHPGFDDATGAELLEDTLDLALYYLDFVDELGLESPHLVGHGLGGLVAAEMAALAPRLFAKLVLIAPLGLELPEAPVADLLHQPAERLLWHDPEEVAELDDDPAALRQRERNLEAAGRYWSPGDRIPLPRHLHRILAPTLIVWGDDDRVLSAAHGEALKQRLRHAQLRIIEAAGHAPQLERGDLYLPAVLEFLEG